jgi:hypothetical protein
MSRTQHDDQCERLPDEGWYICNCRLRDRLARGITEPPGELIHMYPACPGCYEETSHDGDHFICENCHAYWPSSHSEQAEFNDDDMSDVLAGRQSWLDKRRAQK